MWLALIALALVLFGCGRVSPSVDQLLASGKAAQAQGHHRAAIIEFRNVVQKAPDQAEARFLLGLEYQRTGDFGAAERELRQALSLGYDRAKVIAPLGRALLGMEAFQKLLNDPEIEPHGDGRLQAENFALRGSAYLGLGRLDDATDLLSRALQTDPQLTDALLGSARLAVAERRFDDASSLIERANVSAPDDVEAWLLKGHLLRHLRRDGALAAYRKASEIDPENVYVRSNIVLMQLAARRFDEAEHELDEARKLSPRNVMVKYLEALIEYRKGNFTVASRAIQDVLEVGKDHLPTLLLAASIDYANGAYAAAQAHLVRVLDRMPENLFARELLAASLAETGNPERGLGVLRPALERAPNDARLLRFAGDMAIRSNDPAQASEFFERAANVDPKNAGARTGLGVSRFALGETDHALADLETAVKLDPHAYQADFLLAIAHLRRAKFDEALKALQTMESKQPADPLTHNLKAAAYLGKGDKASARKALARALELQPTFVPAALNLALLDLSENDSRAARQRLEEVVKRDPNNVRILLVLAELAPRLGASSAEQTQWLERARQAAPTMAQPRLMLARKHALAGDLAKAREFALQARSVDPDSIEVLDTLAAIQLAGGDRSGAIETYTTLVSREPDSALLRFHLGNAQAMNADYNGAANSLQMALAIKPDYLDALALMAGVEIARDRTQEAMRIVRKVQKQAPKSPLGPMLEGDVLMAEKKFLEAARSYDAAFALGKSHLLVNRIHAAYTQAGRRDIAEARLAQWLGSAPGETAARLQSAETSLTSGKLNEAIEQYEALQQRQPDNYAVANNLAWAYLQVKDPRALVTAERAYRLKPESADVLDTLGWVLVEQGDAGRGIDLLQAAVKAAPAMPSYRFHLAQGWLKAGDRTKARELLEGLLAAGNDFPERRDAALALERLGKER